MGVAYRLPAYEPPRRHRNDHTYIVEGTGPFPMEAMRFDGSEPGSDYDRLLIEDTTGKAPRRVELVIRDAGRFRRPHVQLWEDLGWDVPTETEFRNERSRLGLNAPATEEPPPVASGSLLDRTLRRIAASFARFGLL